VNKPRLKIECSDPGLRRRICEVLAPVFETEDDGTLPACAAVRLSVEPGGELHGLTARQVEVLRLLSQGLCNKEIAAKLGRSVKTVEFHRGQILERLGMHSAVELTRFAIEHGLAFDHK
jgi:DNA-binding NarL/FixJ family response regulator